MLPQGLIGRMLKYYLTSEKYYNERERAFVEFFGENSEEILENVDYDFEGIFNEWLIYDFILDNGKTMIEDYYESNPNNLKLPMRQFIKDLQTNMYDLFEVKKIDLGKGMVVESISTGANFDVQENSATYDLQVGYIFPTRVGKVGDHFELIGANSIVLPVHMEENIKKEFKKESKQITLKDTLELLIGNKGEMDLDQGFERTEEEHINPQEAKEKFSLTLKELNLDHFVSVETVQSWFNKFKDVNPIIFLDILVGLTRYSVNDKKMQPLLQDFTRFYNISLLDRVGGSSQELKTKNPEKFGSEGFSLSMNKIGSDGFVCFDKACKFMESGNIVKAIKSFEKAFEMIYNDMAVESEVYRLFTNKAIAHILNGEWIHAEQLLDMSLMLNPKYDFGVEILKKLHDGKFDKELERYGVHKKSKKEQEHSMANDVAFDYYYFLRDLNIDFETDKITKTKRISL